MSTDFTGGSSLSAQAIADAIAGNSRLVFKGSQQITSDQLATMQSLTVPTGASRVFVQNNGNQPVRWTLDGSTPTATAGMRLSPSDPQLSYSGDLSLIRLIREAEGAMLDVNYFG